MARSILEVSIFWAGELLAVKQLPANRRGTLDELGLPATGDVVVRTRVCAVAPRKRSPIDLPLGALGVMAALVHAMTIASFTSAEQPVTTGEASGTRAASSYVMTTERAPVLDAVEAAPVKPVQIDTSRECPGMANYMLVNHLKRLEQ